MSLRDNNYYYNYVLLSLIFISNGFFVSQKHTSTSSDIKSQTLASGNKMLDNYLLKVFSKYSD